MPVDSDIRKWFLKQPHKQESSEGKQAMKSVSNAEKEGGRGSLSLKKTSKYFTLKPDAEDAQPEAPEKASPAKRKQQNAETKLSEEASGPSSKRSRANVNELRTVEAKTEGDIAMESVKKAADSEKPASSTPGRGRGRGRGTPATAADKSTESPASAGKGRGGGGRGSFLQQRGVPPHKGEKEVPEGTEVDSAMESVKKDADKAADSEKPASSTPGRGRGRGTPGTAADKSTESPASAGRGRGGGGRGYFLQQRGVPPHKGQKEVPEGTEDCLANLTFVISGTLDSLEREEAEDLIKRHGGRVTSSVSKKTNFLLADEDIGGRKSEKAKELGVSFLTEDGLFEMIRASRSAKASSAKETVADKSSEKEPVGRKSRQTEAEARDLKSSAERPSSIARVAHTNISASPSKQVGSGSMETESWTHKYRPRSSTEIIGNQSIVKQLQDWLQHWDEQHLHGGNKGKRRGGGGSTSGGGKKAVLLSGSPGIGKTTTARVISKELGFEAVEVNASDSRGKADSKVGKGIGGSLANAIKEMVNNESLIIGTMDRNSSEKKSVLIMDEVDGMLGGDRGGVTDLIASIKISRIPIICICNDRYSQRLKSLLNYCLALNFRKPTKQQMAKRLQQIARAEGLHVDEIALEELAQEVNGDMRMALNQLQYMSLRSQAIKYDDMKKRLKASAKDEDISPFSAVEKLMGYEGGRLRMDDRLDAGMSDPDLVPLLIEENYLNYIPSLAGRDENGTARMDLVARASASIADGDIVNVQIRRHRQWQHSQMAAFMSSIIPAALMHGKREIFMQGERNFNRFPGWLGKNSSFGKKLRLLEDLHIHLLASRLCEPSREIVRLDMLHVLRLLLIHPLQNMPKDSGVQAVVNFLGEYSMTQEDFETILDVSRFQSHEDPLQGVQPSVKTALTKAYRQREHEHRVKSADLIPIMKLAGQKKVPKKRLALNLNPLEPFGEENVNGDEDLDEEDEGDGNDSSDEDEQGARLHVNGDTNIQKGPKRASQGSTEKKRQAKDTASETKQVKRKK